MKINLNKNNNSHFNQKFCNNNNINNNFNQNNNMNLMNNNIIIQYLKNNKFLIMQIFNYIRQNNNEQMNNYLRLIINCLNQIDNNMNYIMNLINNNYCQINKNNFVINNNIFDNKDNCNKINNNTKIENKTNIDDNFLFKDFENYFPLIGLKNVGSISYMNSILQCLFHIPELNCFFINKYEEQKNQFKKINNDIFTKGRLCEEFHKIVLDIYKDQNKTYISPKGFNNFISQINEQLEEVDVKEFLSYLFQIMHAELNYKGDQKLKNAPKCNQLIEKDSFDFFMVMNNNLNLSIISYLFYGVLKSTTICKGCNNTFYNFQYFQFLSFPTFNYKDERFNLYKGFKEFIRPNLMSGEDRCYCQKCKGLRDMIIKTEIYFEPPYLIINFDYGENKKI